MHTGGFAVLDFGSQYTQLIARRLRELGVYSELFPYDVSVERLREFRPEGIILSGGPNSVDEVGAPLRSIRELQELAPILGVCYGMQLIARDLGGKVSQSRTREYGLNRVTWMDRINFEIPQQHRVWMSHGDSVEVPPPGFEVIAVSESGVTAALRGPRVLTLQFHPEVTHTEHGTDILRTFVFEMCGAKPNWTMPARIDEFTSNIQKKVGPGEKVLCAMSGGVDSTVLGVLVTRALGADRVQCVFVNNGLLRLNEYEKVLETYRELGLNVRGISAEDTFLSRLEGVEDPERKRKIIGEAFIDVFEKAVSFKEFQWLAQGTLYPDVIESVSLRGTSVTIKSHHNVGGLPEKMNLKLLEPFRELFKDEVRELGALLGVPKEILQRHPFPGPGLAVRVLGKLSADDLEVLRQCDDIWIRELKAEGFYEQVWQAFCVLLPIRSVGVQGDSRSYQRVLALRAVTSTDGMTADWFDFPSSFLRSVSTKITNQVSQVNRVVYDVSSKPPATIEWE